jgi:hypothetical protein
MVCFLSLPRGRTYAPLLLPSTSGFMNQGERRFPIGRAAASFCTLGHRRSFHVKLIGRSLPRSGTGLRARRIGT